MPFVYFTWRSFLSSIFPLSPFPPVFIRYLLSLSVCLSVYLFIFLFIYLSFCLFIYLDELFSISVLPYLRTCLPLFYLLII